MAESFPEVEFGAFSTAKQMKKRKDKDLKGF